LRLAGSSRSSARAARRERPDHRRRGVHGIADGITFAVAVAAIVLSYE
jgi:hypothetical protein